MRIEIHDSFGVPHIITSTNIQLISNWLADFAETHMSANSEMQPVGRMNIWPTTPEEIGLLKVESRAVQLITFDDVMAFAKAMTDIADAFPDALA